MANRTKRTPEKRKKFLETLRRTGNVSRACRAGSVGRRTAYEWREADVAFAAAWEEAVEEGLDGLEEEARRRAVTGTLKPIYQGGEKVGTMRVYSDTLLIFLLKGGRPEKYRETSRHIVTGTDDGPIQYADATAEVQRRLAGLAAAITTAGIPEESESD